MAVKLGVVLLAAGLVSIGALALLMGPQPLQPDIVFVAGDGDCQGSPCVRTITAALGIVNRSGTIIVEAFSGTYNETFSVDIPVAIRGENRNTVVLDGGFAGGAVIQVGAAGVTLEEFTVVNNDFAIEARFADDLTIRGVRITGTYGGIVGQRTDRFRLMDSEIVKTLFFDAVSIDDATDVIIGGSGNNISGNEGRGIFVNNSRGVVIIDNVIRGNARTGVNISESVVVTVENNMIEGNGFKGILGTRGYGSDPIPLNGGDPGGLRFFLTDPIVMSKNTIRGNARFGVEVAGARSRDYTLRDNTISGNQGDGLVIMDGATNVDVAGGTIEGNSGWGVVGVSAFDVFMHDLTVAGNGPVPVPTRSDGPPAPRQSEGGGLRFFLTDPSRIQNAVVTGNRGPAIELNATQDFDVVGNTIKVVGAHEGILVIGANRSLIQGNHVRGLDPGFGTGTALIGAQNIRVIGNTYEDLDTGILVQDGCHLQFASNKFIRVAKPFVLEGSPCDVTFAIGSLRFMPRTLNLGSEGQFVTLRIEVQGLDPSVFDLSKLTFTVNGVDLAPPGGSPDEVSVSGDVIRAMVKLDRAEAIAAFGVSGTYTVTVTGEVMPGVTWSASDTVEAIRP